VAAGHSTARILRIKSQELNPRRLKLSRGKDSIQAKIKGIKMLRLRHLKERESRAQEKRISTAHGNDIKDLSPARRLSPGAGGTMKTLRHIKLIFSFLIFSVLFFALPQVWAVDLYTENFEYWTAGSASTWQDKNLSGAPFNVPANAVVEIAIVNGDYNTAYYAGVRANGSGLERRILMHVAEGDDSSDFSDGMDVVVMHVQADASSIIEHYGGSRSRVRFYLLGYWDSGTYVEKFNSFTAGDDHTWRDENLSAYGVSANEIAEIVMVNKNTSYQTQAGVRTNGSGLGRILDLHEAEDGGVDTATMLAAADGTANAIIEVYAEYDSDIDFYLVGYWSTPPGTYTEKFETIPNQWLIALTIFGSS
jgi:hypothetical protein